MKTTITIVFLLVGASSALGQTGVSNQRDMYGNLVRDGNNYSARGVNQGPQNNGPVRSMPTRLRPQTSEELKHRADSVIAGLRVAAMASHHHQIISLSGAPQTMVLRRFGPCGVSTTTVLIQLGATSQVIVERGIGEMTTQRA